MSKENEQTIEAIKDANKTSTKDIAKAVESARHAFDRGKSRKIDFRREQLNKIKNMINEHEDDICNALCKDLRKSESESILLEITGVLGNVYHALDNLKSWTAVETVDKTRTTMFDSLRVYHDPVGVVLILSAWNYPIVTTLNPLIGAIAGGNCAVIKPSEVSCNTQELLAEIIPEFLDRDCYPVVVGGRDCAQILLENKFNHIFYVGGTSGAQAVYTAGQKHLTPLTLELGGKSPVYIDETVDMATAAKRIMWGKLVNAGQTCIAPDYLLCTKEVAEKFIPEAENSVKKMFGENPKESEDFARIINDAHFKRVVSLIDTKKVAFGATYDAADKYIAPTLLNDVTLEDNIMKEEIFGPLLPILTIEHPEDAINLINSRPRPLAFYIFSTSKKCQNYLINKTLTGTVGINDTLIQAAAHTVPFGGTEASGFGLMSGKYTFDNLTHKKGCAARSLNGVMETINKARYPPYDAKKIKSLKQISSGAFFSTKLLKSRLCTVCAGFVAGVIACTIFCASKNEKESTLDDCK